jgi:hypothetical protein
MLPPAKNVYDGALPNPGSAPGITLSLLCPLAGFAAIGRAIHAAAPAVVVGAAAGGEAALFLVLGHNNRFCVLHTIPFAFKVRVTFVLKRGTHAVLMPPTGQRKNLLAL